MEIEEIVNLVKTKHKRIGLRMLYAKYKVKEEDRPKWRDLWDSIAREMDSVEGSIRKMVRTKPESQS